MFWLRNKKSFFFVLSVQKNCTNETVLFRTQNLRIRKVLIFFFVYGCNQTAFFHDWLSRPMLIAASKNLNFINKDTNIDSGPYLL